MRTGMETTETERKKTEKEKVQRGKTEQEKAETRGGKDDNMELYWLWLCSVPELTNRQKQLLLQYFGDPRAVYQAENSEWEIFLKKGQFWISRLQSFRYAYLPSEVWNRMQQMGIHFISREHAEFPQKLKYLPDCPTGLFYQGRLSDLNVPSAAVIGARQCSEYGRYMAHEIGRLLGQAGAAVISGMALGVDGYAQQAALDCGGRSCGVLGSGIDICYPEENFLLYCTLQKRGLLISEYPPSAQPLRHHFPMRNRLISGLADLVIVVEAKKKSGSLITADLALEQGKDVYAVPGRSTDILSSGCNRLIEQGAGIILSPEMVLEHLKIDPKLCFSDPEEKVVLAQEEELVYSYLDLLPKGLEELRMQTDMTIVRLAAVLFQLELKGLAAETTKNFYIRLK